MAVFSNLPYHGPQWDKSKVMNKSLARLKGEVTHRMNREDDQRKQKAVVF